MKKINLEETVHVFKKIKEFKKEDIKTHDYFQCVRCGMTGRKILPNDMTLLVSDIFTDVQIERCQKSSTIVDTYIGKKVKITSTVLHNVLPIFSSFTPGSLHTIIKAPFPFLNGENGVWLQGKGSPIKLSNFDFEFEQTPVIKRTRKK